MKIKKSLGLETHKFVRAKKSLGQNFLKSIPALNAIIKAGEVTKNDVVLEIGPGKGALTERLLEQAGTVIAVEKDYELLDLLKIKFEKEIASSSLVLVHEDILNFEILKFLPDPSYKIIANIPYNITGAILKKFLTEEHQPERMVLMVQNEVAKRIVARDGKESVLSISVKAYGEPKFIMKVPARYFAPAPKVDSAIIAITNISRKLFAPTPSRVGAPTSPKELLESVGEEKFWEIVKTGFAHKRKKLAGNLKGVIDTKKLEEMSVGDKRAEDLSLTDWLTLIKK